MKLTESKLKEFFPRNNRFIHYCAKHYGYTFFNDEAVNDARYFSAVNIINYTKKNGDVFDDESHLVATVMSCIRYGILTAVKPYRKKMRVETMLEADLIYTSGKDQDGTYNKYEANCVSYDQEYGGYDTLLETLRERIESPVERIFLEECMLLGDSVRDVSERHDVEPHVLNLAKYRVRTKFKKIIKEENERVKTSREIGNSYESQVQSVSQSLSDEDRYQRLRKEQDTERSYSETMSFLYS